MNTIDSMINILLNKLRPSQDLSESIIKIADSIKHHYCNLSENCTLIQQMHTDSYAQLQQKEAQIQSEHIGKYNINQQLLMLADELDQHIKAYKDYTFICFNDANSYLKQAKKEEKECTKIESQISTQISSLDNLCKEYDKNGSSASLLLDYGSPFNDIKGLLSNYNIIAV